MPTQHDPEQTEVKYLHDIANLVKAHVLEIGCGDGRLTWRYASHARRVTAIDPDIERLATAYNERPVALQTHLDFAQSMAETLPLRSETFDLAILAWSL